MMVKWKTNKQLKPEVILKRIDEAKTVGEKGSVSFSDFDSHAARAALYTMLDFGPNLSTSLKSQLLWKGLTSAASAGELTKETVLKAINAEYRSYHAAKEIEFLFLTSLSISTPLVQSVKILDCTIRFFQGPFPNKFKSRSKLDPDWERLFRERHTPPDFLRVVILTKAKQSSEAVNKAMRALDVVRGLKCLLFNYESVFTFAPNYNAPAINRIMLGGLHSLHFTDGSLAEDYFWYDVGYQSKTVLDVNKNNVPAYQKHFKRMVRSLRKSNYNYKLSDSLVRYVRAFDERDRNTVLSKAWGALESLAAPNENAYEPVVRRCSFLFVDGEYHRQILEHLREYRNISTHVGEYVDDATTHCYQAQYYFRNLFLWHLGRAGEFETLEDANKFLDLPNDVASLRKNLKLLQRAIQFLSPKPEVGIVKEG